jgi:catechol 2,3-dioxygenase-like lactoylglutathione lyase family enzyme
MNIGKLDLCLKVKDLATSAAFYKKLGFTDDRSFPERGYAMLRGPGFTLALYTSDHISENIINFRGGDVFAITSALKAQGVTFETDAAVESDGAIGSFVRDPDGNLIYFNTSPQEAAQAGR